MKKKRKTYLIYDSHDRDILVYSGGIEGAAHFMGISERAVEERSRKPYEMQERGRYKVICEGRNGEENERTARLEQEVEILRESYFNILTSRRTLEDVKKDILAMRYSDVLKLTEWLNGKKRKKEE